MKSPVLFSIQQTGALSNGGVQSITEVMSRLERHRPIVITNVDNEITDHWRRQGFEVHVEPEQASAGMRSSPAGYARTYSRYFRLVRRLIRQSGTRVVHANDPLAFQLSLLAAKSARAKIALNLRDTLAPHRRPPSSRYRFLFAAADHVFYLSADMARRWRNVATNATRACSVTYSIVDPARFLATPIDPAVGPIVLVMGVFWPKKGQLDFIRHVVPELAREQVPTWFAGDFDSGRNAYSMACAKAAEPYADLVRFLGYQRDLPAIIKQARVVAVPSTHEGLMRGMIEAMSCGRPVVSFDVCSASELLEEESGGAGIVVRGGDFDGMARAILNYCTDAGAASTSGEKGDATAARLFAPDEVVRRYENVYETLGSRS